MESELSEERFCLVSDAARIGEVEVGTLRAWLQLGHLKLLGPPAARGETRLLSERELIAVTVMACLVSMGLKPPEAGAQAIRFAEQGEGGEGPDGRPSPGPRRLPGHLYEEGLTYFVFNPLTRRGRFINGPADIARSDLQRAVHDPNGRNNAVWCCEINTIWDSTRVAAAQLRSREKVAARRLVTA